MDREHPYDNWGLWAVNVYANQRHLMLGVALLLILVILPASRAAHVPSRQE